MRDKIDSMIKQLISEIEKDGISYYVIDPQDYMKDTQQYMRVIFTGGDARKCKKWQERLNRVNGHDEEAALILEYAKNNQWLMDIIEERAAIRGADGLPDSLSDAVKTYF